MSRKRIRAMKEVEIRAALHSRLKQVRLDSGLTQTSVGKKLGAHASFVSTCESGERRSDVIELAFFYRLYGITLSDFLKRRSLPE